MIKYPTPAEIEKSALAYHRRARARKAPSERATVEPAGPLGSLAVATCSLPGLESEILRVAQALENNALTRDAIAGDGLALSDLQQKCGRESEALRASAQILRRHVASANVRQPEGNVEISHDRERKIL